MREACLDCGIKHLGQAAVLMHEVKKGYEYHFVYVVGHLAEMEDELIQKYPEWTKRIRAVRQAYMRGEDIDIDILAEDYYKFVLEMKE